MVFLSVNFKPNISDYHTTDYIVCALAAAALYKYCM